MSNSRDDSIDALKYSMESAPGQIFYAHKELKKSEKEIQEQLDRIEKKLDKLFGPQLINGVWR